MNFNYGELCSVCLFTEQHSLTAFVTLQNYRNIKYFQLLSDLVTLLSVETQNSCVKTLQTEYKLSQFRLP